MVFSAALISGASCAQITIEPSFSTDSIDLFSENKGPQKSPTLAMAASLLLPGTGHQYYERNRPALAYLTVEAAALFGAYFCSRYAKKTAVDAAGYAWIHSGATGTISDADDYYWKLIGNFMDTEEYYNVLDLNREPSRKTIAESQFWHWDDESYQERYNAMRSTSRSYRIISSFFLGALVLNRAVAFIDMRTYTRRSNIKRSAGRSLEITPVAAANGSSLSLSLLGSF
jgi:hypothetical protein